MLVHHRTFVACTDLVESTFHCWKFRIGGQTLSHWGCRGHTGGTTDLSPTGGSGPQHGPRHGSRRIWHLCWTHGCWGRQGAPVGLLVVGGADLRIRRGPQHGPRCMRRLRDMSKGGRGRRSCEGATALLILSGVVGMTAPLALPRQSMDGS